MSAPMSETDLMRALQKQATKLGARLFRQNAGMGWIGAAVKFSDRRNFTAEPGDVLIRNARPFHAGVQGMSDLGGWVPVEITADMVGQRIAVYAAVEVKTKRGRATEQQRAFIDAVRGSGGYAGVARDNDDLTDILCGRASD